MLGKAEQSQDVSFFIKLTIIRKKFAFFPVDFKLDAGFETLKIETADRAEKQHITNRLKFIEPIAIAEQ